MKKIYLLVIGLMLLTYFSGKTYAQTIPNWTKTDTKGHTYTLHDVLAEGNAVILDFFATWCGPCAQSTPALESIWQDYDTSNCGLFIFGMDVDNSESDAQIEAFKSNYGATYHSFKQSATEYNYYNNLYGSGSIPLFVLLIPDTADPGNSEVVWDQTGWSPPVENALRNEIIAQGYQQGPCFATGIRELSTVTDILLYPNPAMDATSIVIDQLVTDNISVDLYNNLGQKTLSIFNGTLHGGVKKTMDIDLSKITKGVYYVRIQGNQGSNMLKLNVF